MGNRRFTDPAQAQAGERDAKLCRGDVVIEVFDCSFSGFCARVAFFSQLGDARAARSHQREFGGHEEAVNKDERKDGQQAYRGFHAG